MCQNLANRPPATVRDVWHAPVPNAMRPRCAPSCPPPPPPPAPPPPPPPPAAPAPPPTPRPPAIFLRLAACVTGIAVASTCANNSTCSRRELGLGVRLATRGTHAARHEDTRQIHTHAHTRGGPAAPTWRNSSAPTKGSYPSPCRSSCTAHSTQGTGHSTQHTAWRGRGRHHVRQVEAQGEGSGGTGAATCAALGFSCVA